VKNTSNTVIIQSLTKCERSNLILSAWSRIVLIFKFFGKIHLSFIDLSDSSPSVTKLTIDHHCFFTTHKVTALSEGFHQIESLEILVIFLGDS
jgi:hypothetical protein